MPSNRDEYNNSIREIANSEFNSQVSKNFDDSKNIDHSKSFESLSPREQYLSYSQAVMQEANKTTPKQQQEFLKQGNNAKSMDFKVGQKMIKDGKSNRGKVENSLYHCSPEAKRKGVEALGKDKSYEASKNPDKKAGDKALVNRANTRERAYARNMSTACDKKVNIPREEKTRIQTKRAPEYNKAQQKAMTQHYQQTKGRSR